LINEGATDDPEQAELRNTLLDDLHQHVATMERSNFLVRRHLQTVEEFSNRERWEQLNEDDVEAISVS
jgi:type I restriction enzyme R subunit